MMRPILALILLCLTALGALGADLTLAWDYEPTPGEPVAAFVVYERAADGKTWAKIGTAAGKEYTVKNIAKGGHVYVVSVLLGSTEGGRSNELFIPKEVTNLRATFIVEVK